MIDSIVKCLKEQNIYNRIQIYSTSVCVFSFALLCHLITLERVEDVELIFPIRRNRRSINEREEIDRLYLPMLSIHVYPDSG